MSCLAEHHKRCRECKYWITGDRLAATKGICVGMIKTGNPAFSKSKVTTVPLFGCTFFSEEEGQRCEHCGRLTETLSAVKTITVGFGGRFIGCLCPDCDPDPA